MGARIVRVFSYWRSVDPDACFDRVASALRELADRAGERSLILGIENEHACNIATGSETARLLAAVDHPALSVIWDPANAFVAGEVPYPQGYRHIPLSRIAHVHAKDCTVANHVPTFGPLGEMGPGSVDWRGQLAALARDGYRGTVSLETHWKGPNGDKFQGSIICGRNLSQMVAEATENEKRKTKTKIEKENDQTMLELEVLHHVAISVSDLARAKAFYGGVLGLEEIARPAFPFDGAWYRVGNQEVHLIVSRDPTFRTGKGVTLEDCHFALRAKSFRAALAHLEAKGCHEGGDEPGRSMRVNRASVTGYPQIHVLDPDRNVIEINAETGWIREFNQVVLKNSSSLLG